ncbi:probable transmembrane protein UsgS [Cephalotrichum gorgonifer]|uniref:Probable transmembrane protein UsgS n=1 Tax=Cephalotrichum gorgonifer TaxID=2041049 RepID=A0AAE8N316_9PEZI|nr:probable transmembrane protein UsgS [Cephalotrichum gorgonifer]
MASHEPVPIDVDRLKQKFDLSHFDLNAVLRGVQLTFVGANRALQNPGIFTNRHYKQAAYAVAAGIVIRLVIAVPIFVVKILLWVLSFFMSMEDATWDDTIVNGLDFIAEYVLQVPLFLMVLMRYVTPTLDDLFMESLRWVDTTYLQKHKSESPDTLRSLYYPNLSLYKPHAKPKASAAPKPASSSTSGLLPKTVTRFLKKGLISLAVYALSFAPLIGPLVLPAASFYTFNRAVGPGPASAIFAVGVFLPRAWLVIFLQAYYSSRSLMRELLEPYFSRVHFTSSQRNKWFQSRSGILFGFALGFNVLVRVPLVGVLVYGIAEAATAYLVTKITDPPPAPQEAEAGTFAEGQVVWKNKQRFLSLGLGEMDAFEARPRPEGGDSGTGAGGAPDGEPPSYHEAVMSSES